MANITAEQARELYARGITPANIAKQLNISSATVRSWKHRYKWDNPGQCNVSQKRNVAPKAEKCVAKKKLDEKLMTSVEKNKELNDPQKIFCLHYIRTFNAAASYRRAFPGCAESTARTEGSKMLTKPNVRNELQQLKKIRNADLLATGDDVIERMMQIAFADLTDFVTWGRYEVGPFTDMEGNEITQEVNDVRFINSSDIDGTLVTEVKKGRDGISVKLADRMKALVWLADYFELNPADIHRREYDKFRLQLEAQKMEAQLVDSHETALPNDGFIDALFGEAEKLWEGDSVDDSQENWVTDNDVEQST